MQKIDFFPHKKWPTRMNLTNEHMSCTSRFLKNAHTWGKCKTMVDLEIEKVMGDENRMGYIIPAGTIIEKSRPDEGKITITAEMYRDNFVRKMQRKGFLAELEWNYGKSIEYISPIKEDGKTKLAHEIFAEDSDLIKYQFYYEGLHCDKK